MKIIKNNRKCFIKECNEEYWAVGFCKKHYYEDYYKKEFLNQSEAFRKKIKIYENFNDDQKAKCTYCKEPLTPYNCTVSRMKVIIKSSKLSLPCRNCDNKKNNERRAKNADRYESNRLKRLYNITLADYYEMFKKQDGKCAICEEPPKPDKNGKIKKFNVDHDHETGKARELLCSRCNHRIIGVLEKSCKAPRKILANLMKYFQKHPMKGD